MAHSITILAAAVVVVVEEYGREIKPMADRAAEALGATSAAQVEFMEALVQLVVALATLCWYLEDRVLRDKAILEVLEPTVTAQDLEIFQDLAHCMQVAVVVAPDLKVEV